MLDARLLSQVEVFQGMNAGELEKIQGFCRPDQAAGDQVIAREGQEARDLFFLCEGEVDLRYALPGRPSNRQMTMSTINPGGSFGWSAFVPPRRYTLSAHCASPKCVYCRLDARELGDLFERQPRIGYLFMRNLAQVIGRRFHLVQDDLARIDGFDLMDQRAAR